jgi:hypothetical protein
VSGTGSTPDDPGRRLEELLAEHREPAAEPDEEVVDPFAPVPGQVGHGGGTENGDGNVAGDGEPEGEPGDDLPDAPLFALLRTVEAEIEVERIDRIWVFPPRRLEAGETAVVVVGAYVEAHPDRRRVYATHYTVATDAPEPRLVLDEFGTAPADRVGRLVEDVVERIKDGPADAPATHRIEASPERWHEVLHALAESHLEEVRRNPGLRR